MNGILSDETMIVRSKGQPSATVGDRTVLMNVQSRKYAGLDPVGSEIRIERPASVEALRDDLPDAFEAEPETRAGMRLPSPPKSRPRA